MNTPVDETTLRSWSLLLGLDERQRTQVVERIEMMLRIGFAVRPESMSHITPDIIENIPPSDFAVMFLAEGLRAAGYPMASKEVTEQLIRNLSK